MNKVLRNSVGHYLCRLNLLNIMLSEGQFAITSSIGRRWASVNKKVTGESSINIERIELFVNMYCRARFRIARVGAFRPEGRMFESRSSRRVGTLGMSFTCICLWRSGVKLRHSIPAVVRSASE